MPVLKALAVALPAILLVASPVMALAPPVEPCESADDAVDSAPAASTDADADAETAMDADSETATSEDSALIEQLAVIPPADCEAAPAPTPEPAPGEQMPAPDLGEVSDVLVDGLGDVLTSL